MSTVIGHASAMSKPDIIVDHRGGPSETRTLAEQERAAQGSATITWRAIGLLIFLCVVAIGFILSRR